MKRTGLIFILTVCLLAFGAGLGAVGAYEVPPGVLSPDEVDFGGKTVTIVSSDF